MKRNDFSKPYIARKGCYCSCIPKKGKSGGGILIGADSSHIYLAEGKILSGHDTINFYGDFTYDLNETNWVSIDTISFPIDELYRVVSHQRPCDRKKSKADKFIEWMFEPTSRSHAGDFIGACIIALPIITVVYPTEYFLHPDNRRVRSFDMRIWEVKK